MSEKVNQTSPQPDFEKIYKTVCAYVECNLQSTRTKPSLEENENLSRNEVGKKKSESEEQNEKLEKDKKTILKRFEKLCSDMEAYGMQYLGMYVDAAIKLYEEKSEWKRGTKAMLVNPKSLKAFRVAHHNMTALYPLLKKINDTFPIDDYAELSLNPKAAIYGSEINKTQNGSTKKAPLQNIDIFSMLDVFLQVNDYKLFYDWVMAILRFNPSWLVDGIQKEFTPKRKELQEGVLNQLRDNDKYRNAILTILSDGANLSDFLETVIAQSQLQSRQASQEDKLKKLEEEKEKDKAKHEELQKEMSVSLQEKDDIITSLRQKENDFERCKKQLTDISKRYQAEVDINEMLAIETERRLDEIETENKDLLNELADVKEQLESLQSNYTALESDFSLKNNELMRLKETVIIKEKTAKLEVMRDLINGIKEQLYYLAMFYLDLQESGTLAPENIDLFADTLNKIDSVLSELGIEKIGILEQKVAYDASIHTSTGDKITNGEQVIIRGYGWKIGEEIFAKALVEKGE